MKELAFSLAKNNKPQYLKIADAIRDMIINRQLLKGECIPSTRYLAEAFKVHRHTVTAGLEELVAEGWLTSKERRFFQVSNELPSTFFNVKQQSKIFAKTPFHWRMVRKLYETPQIANFSQNYKYNFQSGLADLRLFPEAEFRSILLDAYREFSIEMMTYGDPQGHPLLVEAIKIYLRRVRAIVDREIILTHGSQEAIFHIAQLLLKPNDYVAVERLGYYPAWEAFNAAGAKLVPIDMDDEGIKLESLEKLVKTKKIRLIYITPLHQYPTTITLNAARRLGLYQLATKYHVPILEDDYDHEFHYRSQPIAPLASQDPSQQIIYVSTFSKILFPSARIGFIAAPKQIIDPLITYKRISSRQNSTMIQCAVGRWMQEGGFERHLRRMRRVYEERMQTLLTCVNDAKNQGLHLSCREPEGGMAIWLNTHTNADKIMEQAAKQSVRAPSESFYTLKKCNPTHLRLSFANQNSTEIKAGMKIILDCLKNKF